MKKKLTRKFIQVVSCVALSLVIATGMLIMNAESVSGRYTSDTEDTRPFYDNERSDGK